MILETFQSHFCRCQVINKNNHQKHRKYHNATLVTRTIQGGFRYSQRPKMSQALPETKAPHLGRSPIRQPCWCLDVGAGEGGIVVEEVDLAHYATMHPS